MGLKTKLLAIAVLMGLGAGDAVAVDHSAVGRALDQIGSHGDVARASINDRYFPATSSSTLTAPNTSASIVRMRACR